MKLKRVTELTEKDEKREREFVMMCLAVTCGCGTLAEALRLVLAVMDWHEGTLTDGWVLAMRSVNLVVCAVCAWLTFLIIREVKQRRVFTRQNAQYISLIGSAATFGGIAQSAAVGLQYAIMDWSRKAEYTADRAGLIASADYDATMSQTMKLLGHSDHISCIDFSIDEVLKQAEDFEMETSDLIGKLLYANFTLMATHPWSILRLKQLYEWKKSGEYDAVVRAHSGEG